LNELIPILAFLIIWPIVTSSEDPITVEGDGLELVRDYTIIDEKFELVYENEELSAELEGEQERLIPLVLYNFKERPWSKLVYLNGKLELKKVINGQDGFGGVGKSINPIADTGYYVKRSGTTTEFAFYPAFKYDVIGLSEGYITTVTGFGVVFLIEENEVYWISNPSGKSLFKELNVYDIEGNLRGRIEREHDSLILPYHKDKPWIIISGTRRGYGGLGVYDLSENLIYTFDGISRGWPLYGSASYIAIKSEKEHSESKIISVYNGACELMWDYKLSEEEHRRANTRIKVSENEKYICIFTENRLKGLLDWKLGFKVLDIATGEEIYGVENAGVNNGYIQSLSNDGLKLLVYQRDYPLVRYSKLLLINNGKTIGEVSTHPDDGKIEGYLTPDGKYLIAGVPARIKVFKIKP
jgi:hypothetical protein